MKKALLVSLLTVTSLQAMHSNNKPHKSSMDCALIIKPTDGLSITAVNNATSKIEFFMPNGSSVGFMKFQFFMCAVKSANLNEARSWLEDGVNPNYKPSTNVQSALALAKELYPNQPNDIVTLLEKYDAKE